MNKLITLLAIAFYVVIVLFPASAIALPLEAKTRDALQQAAQKVIADDSAKEQFGKTESGDLLLDSAKTKASKKLHELANTDDAENLSDSKKLFLKNLTVD